MISRLEQLGQPDQVAGRGGEGEQPADPGGAPVSGLAKAARGLHPAERLLDALADPLAERVAGMARDPAVDRRAARGVLRDMRRDVEDTDGGDEVRGIIALVGAECGRWRPVWPASMAPAAARSAVPVAAVSMASTSSPLWFSMSRWPIWQSFASLPRPRRIKRASGSVVEAWVALVRFSPWKSRSALRPPPAGGSSSAASLGLKLFIWPTPRSASHRP